MSAGTPTQDGPQTRRRQLPRVGRARHRRGFTFIELMVAISIIAVLMAIMLPRLVEARYQAYHSACIENERNIATALESYQVDNRGYPPSLLTLSQDPAKAYISTVPVCPSDPAQPYNYTVSSDAKTFTLFCTGAHGVQVPGIYTQGYPQYYSSGQLVP